MDDKRNGQIMWKNSEGFGIELFEKRNGAEPDIARIQMRVDNGSN